MFYRRCFEILQQLRQKTYQTYQQLFLAQHRCQSEGSEHSLLALHEALVESVRDEVKAERSWMALWGIKLKKPNLAWVWF
jgi:hypothetical protein